MAEEPSEGDGVEDDVRPAERQWRGRYFILLFDCLICFGLFYCTAMSSALQAEIQAQQTNNCTNHNKTQCCKDCLGLGPLKYNTLRSVSSWANSIVVLPAAVIVDKTGIRLSAPLFSGIAVVGVTMFITSTIAIIRGTSAMFPMMLGGQVLLSFGAAPSRIVQDRTIAIWFKDRLAMAFSLIVMWYRIGNLLNYFITENIAEGWGLTYALLAGLGFACVSFLSSVCLSFLDKYGSKKISVALQNQRSAVMRLKDIRDLKTPFWLICAMLTTYISFLNGFTSDSMKYIQDMYGFSKTTSSYMTGALFDVFVVWAPILGLILDKIGLRIVFATAGALLNFLVLLSIIFTTYYPLIFTVLLGFGSTTVAVSLWPSIAHVVPLKVVGTANGIALCMVQMCGGFLLLGIGKILGTVEEPDPVRRERKWKIVLSLLAVSMGLCILFGTALNVVDKKMGTNLNIPKVESNANDKDEQKPLLNPARNEQYTPSINRT